MKNMADSSVSQRKVNRLGVYFQGRRYYHPKLLKYEGTIVFAQMKRKGLRITDGSGNLICLAEADIFV
jgi:hypothetical protein